jgi:hypothetical protein
MTILLATAVGLYLLMKFDLLMFLVLFVVMPLPFWITLWICNRW